MNLLDQIAVKIIREQELVIGPLAWSEAEKVQGLHVLNQKNGEIDLNGDPKETVNKLVRQYERLFGKASREVCRNAVLGILADLAPSDIPAALAA